MKFSMVGLLPEFFLTLMIVIILLVDAFASTNKRKCLSYALTLFTLIMLVVLQLMSANLLNALNMGNIANNGVSTQSNYLFSSGIFGGNLLSGIFSNVALNPLFNSGMSKLFVIDSIAMGGTLAIYLLAILLVLYSYRYVLDKQIPSGEFYAIFLFALLGMMVMIIANNLLTLYVGLELLSLAMCGLVALNRDNVRATEAAMKFFILTSLASGILLFGMSFIYGATGGNLQLDDIFNYSYSHLAGANNYILSFGLVFIVAGLCFKLGLAPFHAWVVDVYEGSPMIVTAVIASITKIAAVIFVLRFLISALVVLQYDFVPMLWIGAILSLFIGNVVAIAQSNIKRMIGYSAIANLGFVALGIVSMSFDGIVSLLFYVVVYAITIVSLFGILMLLSRGNYECEQISDLTSLSKSHPLYAAMLAILLLSMAGLPPLVGFYAKFKILTALVAQGYIATAIYAVILSLIGAFYYLRIIKVMYFDDAPGDLLCAVEGMSFGKLVLFINCILIVILGVMPNALLKFCTQLLG